MTPPPSSSSGFSKALRNLPGLLPIALLRFYKYAISPHLPNACRFTPTCSEYGIQAIQKYGALKGSYLAMKRILSCHPWGRHGHDPVP